MCVCKPRLTFLPHLCMTKSPLCDPPLPPQEDVSILASFECDRTQDKEIGVAVQLGEERLG